MRAALLPTTGDPFVVAYWLRNYATWRDEVDELVVLVNTSRGGDDLAFVRREIEAAGGRVVYADIALGHGGAIKRLMHETTADYVVLCEEDAFVRTPGAVAAAFDRIEAGHVDVIGSPRGEEHWRVDWGPYDPSDPAEITHNLWPCFLFARAVDLRATSQKFGDPRFVLGEDIPGLGTCTEEHCRLVGVAEDRIHLDTFAGTTFELRAAGLRVELVHYVRLYDLTASVQFFLDKQPPWFHITGSSQLPHITQYHTPIETLPDNGPGGGQWIKRLAWWERMVEAVDAPGRDAYRDQFAKFRESAAIDEKALADWSVLFSAVESREMVRA